MKSFVRLSAAFLLMLSTVNLFSQCLPIPPIDFINPSFEGTPQPHVTPGPWSICMPGQTPDTQPGSWGVTMAPTNGSSYLGLVHQPSTGWQEGAAEQLGTPLVAGTTYTFNVDVANVFTAQSGVGILPGCAELQIWGGYGACDKNTLLWASGNIAPYDTWITETVSFTASQNFSWVLFQINSLGCTDGPYILVDNITTVNATPLTVTPTVINATCNGTNTGSAYLSYSGGTQPVTFQWSNGPTTQNNSNLFAGTYGVTATDARQCTASASITITDLPVLAVNVTTTDAGCGLSNGSATANVTSGSGPFTYVWSNQRTIQTITNIAPGTYTVTVTGAGGCTATASGFVQGTGGLNLSTSSVNTSCGGLNGSVTVNVNNGPGVYTYLWSTQDVTQTVTNLGSGTYSVTVNGGNCSASATVSVAPSSALTIAASSTATTCGNSNGTADVAVLTGDGPFAYSWNTQDATQSLSSLAAGTYSVTVTGLGGCSATASTTVDPSTGLTLSTSSTDADCGLSTGSATVDVTTGTGPFTYLWSNQEITQTISNLAIGNYSVTVTGAASCSATADVLVSVIDVIPPVAVCQDITIALNGTTASITANDIDGGSTDNCGIIARDATPTTFDCSDLGGNRVTLTVTDGGGNTSNCVATVTVNDTTPPAAVCQDITVPLSGNSVSITAADVDNNSTDNCAIVTRDVTPNTFNCSNRGANTVTFTATDASGNSGSCTATVTITDITAPVAQCRDITVSLNGGGQSSILPTSVDSGSTDNCAIVSRVVSPNVYNCSMLGANTATLTVADASGNTNTCTATVTVRDNISPSAICQSATVTLSGTTASITPADVDDNSHDNCAIVSRAVTPNTFDCSNLGANQVSLTVTDASGNSSSCLASVTVLDATPPTALCKDASVSLTGSTATISASDVDNNSTDNCAIVSRTVTPSTFDCSQLGANNTVTFTATDASGNSSSCTANVTISDNIPPVAITKDITVSLIGSSVSITAADVDNSSTDNCTIISRDVVPNTFTCSELGSNTVTLTVTDQSGNTSSAPAIVTVIDDTPPTALCNDLTVTLVNGAVSITPADADNNSTDNCSIISRTLVPTTFDCSSLGSNTAVLTVIDQSNNSSSCNSQVTVLGSAPFTCSIESRLAPSNQNTGGSSTTIYLGYGPQSTTLQSTVTGQGQFTYSWTPSTDLSCTTCPSPVFTPTAGGNYTFTLTVTSANGCSSHCEITICVLDIRVQGGCGGGRSGGNENNNPGHVYICHYPPGNVNNMQTICIGVAGVPAHVPLHGGDRLGKCEQTCGSSKTGDEDLPELITDQNAGFDMVIYPNPFSSQFRLKVESESNERIDIKIFNVMGQLISSENGIEANHDVYLGNSIANGFYFLEVTQAGFKKTIRVTKAK